MDNVYITAIDQTLIIEGITTATVNVTVNSIVYPQIFTIYATDALTVQAQIMQQAEIARSQIVAAGPGITNTTTLSGLVGATINL